MLTDFCFIFGTATYLMKKSFKKFVTTIPCRFGYHQPNWFMQCMNCKRLLKSGVFFEPRPLGKRSYKPNMIEIFPEEVATGFMYDRLKLMPRRRNFERDVQIKKLFGEWGNKSRVARVFGISTMAVIKALRRLERDKLIHSEAIDLLERGSIMEAEDRLEVH